MRSLSRKETGIRAGLVRAVGHAERFYRSHPSRANRLENKSRFFRSMLFHVKRHGRRKQRTAECGTACREHGLAQLGWPILL